MMDRTDRQLTARFATIANRENDSDWQAIVREAVGRKADRRRLSAPALIAAVLLVTGALAALVAYERADTGGSGTAAPTAPSRQRPPVRPRVRTRTHTTPVRTLAAFTYRKDAVAPSDLPAGVAEVVTQMGADPTSAQEPFPGPPSVYLFHRGGNNLCMVVAIAHAGGSCWSALTSATGAISDPSISIVDGKLFATGLAANSVRAITAALAGTPQTPATTRPAVVENNVFVVSLPYNGGGIGAVTITVTRTDGTSQSITMPGVPAPAP